MRSSVKSTICLKYQAYFDRNFLYIHQNKVFIVF